MKKRIYSPLIRKLFVWFGIAIILFAIMGFLVLPLILKSILVSKLSNVLHREISVEKSSLILSHSVCLENVDLAPPDVLPLIHLRKTLGSMPGILRLPPFNHNLLIALRLL